ncbi:MAG: zinc ribbon domain-containing protein [Chloroflexota bacterium]
MIDPNHDGKRQSLRSLGMVLTAVGGLMLAIGMIDFFSAFGSFRPPQLFWCAFVGMPLLGLGARLLKFGYMGAATRYVAGEIAPVAKDTIKYMGEQTEDTIADIARAVITGADPQGRAVDPGVAHCAACGADNPPDARFCSTCGADLNQSRRCPKCGEANAPDAKFCHHCGRPLG